MTTAIITPTILHLIRMHAQLKSELDAANARYEGMSEDEENSPEGHQLDSIIDKLCDATQGLEEAKIALKELRRITNNQPAPGGTQVQQP